MTHLVKSRRESQEFWLRPAKAIDPLKSDNLVRFGLAEAHMLDPLKSDNLLCPLLDSTF